MECQASHREHKILVAMHTQILHCRPAPEWWARVLTLAELAHGRLSAVVAAIGDDADELGDRSQVPASVDQEEPRSKSEVVD
mmetsp:Transcript_45823/g.147134  ORF Transcript_45823/g.147134 Transcript_45823/m.147134 type:complete len:82 (+) Transcript_45823:412-657(+)